MVMYASVTYGWFNNVIEKDNITLRTGSANVTFRGYLVDENEVYENDPIYYDVISDGVKSNLLSNGNININLTPNTIEEVIFVIEKDSDSFDLDCFLDLAVPSLYNEERIDLSFITGYYFSLKNVTSDVLNADEDLLFNKINYYLNYDNERNASYHELSDAKSLSSNIGIQEITSSNQNVLIYHLYLKVGNDYNILYTNNIFPLSFKIYISLYGQLNAIALSSSVTKWHYANNLDTLLSAIDSYQNGDTIIINNSINHYGDLIFNKPVRLFIQNSSMLNIYGNLVFSYGGYGDFLFNISNNCEVHIYSSTIDNGFIYINTPNSSFEVVGKGLDGYIHGDIFISSEKREKVIINASTNTEDDNLDHGLIIDKLSIYNQNNEVYTLSDIYVLRSSDLLIKEYSHINDIIALSNLDEVNIKNYANIHNIDLSLMTFIGNSTKETIKIDNYGSINNIILPFDAKKFTITNSNNHVTYNGNTNITFYTPQSNYSKVTSGEMILYLDDEGLFCDNDILKLPDTGYSFYKYDNTIKELEINYRAGAISLASDLENILDRTGVSLPEIKRLIIKTSDNRFLTLSDYETINSFSNLEYLNLEAMRSVNLTLPDDAFSSLSHLSTLILPHDMEIDGNPFSGTNVTELAIPNSYLIFDDNSFSSINKIYYYQTNSLVNLGNFIRRSDTVLFVHDETTYNNFLSLYVNQPEYCKKIVLLGEKIGPYYVRTGTDGLNTLVYYENSEFNLSDAESSVYHFNFKTITKDDGSIITINNFGNYVFFEKILENTNITFSNYLSKIGKYAFASSPGIKRINISSINSAILEQNCFNNCSNLSTIDLENIITIKESAFFNCSNLENVILSNVKEIKSSAFSNCQKFKSLYLDGTENLDARSFYNCDIHYVIAPDLISMGTLAFGGNYHMVSFKAPKLRRIGSDALPQSRDLVILETGVISSYLDNNFTISFYNTKTLHWYLNTDSGLIINDYTIFDNINTSISIYLSKLAKPKTSDSTYYDSIKAYESSYFKIYGIDTLNVDGFMYKTMNINNVTLSKLYTSDDDNYNLPELGFGNYVFYKINEEEVALIDVYATQFKNEVTLPDRVLLGQNYYYITQLIGNERLFKDITFSNLNLNLPQNLRCIDDNLFLDKLSLKIIKLDYIENIGDYSFKNTGLSTVSMPNVKTLGLESFSSNSNLNEVIFGCKITDLGTNTFNNCHNLLSLIMPGSDNILPTGTSIINPESINERFCIFVNAYRYNNEIINLNSLYGVNINSFKTIEEVYEINDVTYYVNFQNGSFIIEYIIVNTNIISLTLPSVITRDSTNYNVTGIGTHAFRSIKDNISIKNILLPSNLSYFNPNLEDLPVNHLSWYISSSNTSFITASGILFNKDKTYLISYPKCINQSSFTIPTTTCIINDNAFYGTIYLNDLYIANNVIINNSFKNSSLKNLYLNNTSAEYKFLGNNTFEGVSNTLLINISSSQYDGIIKNIYSDPNIISHINCID